MLAALLPLLLPLACGARAQSADLVLRGGKVFVGPGRYASAVAVRGNRIAGLGADKEISALKGPRTRVIDLKGRTVVPGFHDAHVRLLAGALRLFELDLSGAADADDVRRRVLEYGARLPKDGWVIGRGFDEALLSTGTAATPLEVLASTRPAALVSAGGGALWVNAEALRRLRPEALRNARTEPPTGVLRGEAMASALKRLPAPDRARKLAALQLAFSLMRESGVTAVDEFPDAGEPPTAELLSLWRELAQRGLATARLVLFGRLDQAADYLKLRAAARDLPRTRVLLPGVALSMDGSVGERTAYLLEPYFDAPETKGGMPKLSGLELTTRLRTAHDRGLQVSVHAAGDRAVRLALDSCEKSAPKAREQGAVLPRYPCRIEDPELVSPDDMKRFRRDPAALAVQPARLAFPDVVSNYYGDRLGAAVKSALPLNTLQDARALMAFGSGWPDRPLAPQAGLYGAVARKSLDGRPPNGLVPGERLTLDAALDHAANDPWELAGLGDELGDIRPGRIADLVVLDRDIFTASAGERAVLDAKVDMTVFDGRVVFEREP